MEQLKAMKEALMASAQGQMGNLDKVNAKELGEVIDMVKDLAEAEYYCSVTKAMEESKEKREDQDKIEAALNSSRNYYTPMMYDPRFDGNYSDRMYYGGGMRSSGSGMRHGYDSSMPSMARDYREGRSYAGRRGYMESKEMHEDSSARMMKLREFINESKEDLKEMMKDATPEEKQLIQNEGITFLQSLN